ncbi:MAG: hypothetical protein J7501_12700 [Bdellovibrio sp.]|nr:hypothetical protein [Bdellovibrio sp.]
MSSLGPVTGEAAYKVDKTVYNDPITVSLTAKFRYRNLYFTKGSTTNGLREECITADAAPIAFAEFKVFNASGVQVQQGETDTDGNAVFELPKTIATYTIKVYSRSYNDYVKVSVLKDTYTNTPYSVSNQFTVSSTSSPTLDLTASPFFARADENASLEIEGGAFNIMFDILLANEYVRRQIGKNTLVSGKPSTNVNEWWVADKVTVYWKAGFNPRSYFSDDGALLSFYVPTTSKLYILGGKDGNVKESDTDHFDDSVILHEYAHFLEDVYGKSESPGGSHDGNFIIDPRLAWSEGWANYFQAAVLSGTANVDAGNAEWNVPAEDRYRYYVDTVGYKNDIADTQGKIAIAFDLTDDAATATLDNLNGSPSGEGTFREVSISRSLYKSSRNPANDYSTSGIKGGGVTFANFWKVFAGEDNAGSNRSNPLTNSFVNATGKYPEPNVGLFNYLLTKYEGTLNSNWNDIVAEEKQRQSTQDYAWYLNTDSTNSTCTFSFSGGVKETTMEDSSLPRSNQHRNNDFFIIYHTQGVTDTLLLNYTSDTTHDVDLDLYVYKNDYIYIEDYYLAGGYNPSLYMATYARRNYSIDGGTNGIGSESVTLKNQATGWYVINVKVNMYGKSSAATSTANYTLKKNGVTLCAKEQ